MDIAGNAIHRHVGHDFKRRTFFHPTYCEHCSDMLWGIKGQGFVCRICRFTCHEKCMNHLITLCPYLALTRITKPLAHKWGKAVTTSRRFCNVCRRKADSSILLSCQVCNYYTHKNCKMFAMVNCKATSLYIDTLQTSSLQHTHHWIEGNLPKGKCEVCIKSISSDQCLHGQKCTWCGITVHSCCFSKLAKPKECDYRDLACIVLVPEAVEWYGSDLGRVFAADQVSESPVDELNDDDEDKDNDEKGYHVIVYDDVKACHQPLKRSSTQRLLVTKKMNAKDVLTLALKKFQIPEEGDQFCLIESTDEATTKPVHNTDMLFEMVEATSTIPKLVIVPKEQDDGKTRLPIVIYNQLLGSTIPTVKLSITKSSTVASIIQDALIIFEMEDEQADNFVLEQVSLYCNAQAIQLDPLHSLWDTITFLKSQPIRKSSLTRFYLRKKVISRFTLAVWGIPKDNVQNMKSTQGYIEKLLPSNLLENTKFGPLYPNAKLVFIDCPSLYMASQICNTLDQAPEKLQHYILPNIHPNAIKMEMAIRQEPLLVFVNGRSGGNQGLDLLTKFRHYLNPHQVFDLANGGPHIGLHAFRDFSQFRILIGGGDGTFGWVLSVLEEAQDALQCKEPPCALLPLGTGNDLARVLSWGPGYSGEKVLSILRSVENANLVHLDRWKLTFKPQQIPTVSVIRKNPDLAQAYGFTNITSLDYELSQEKDRTVVMNNYFGIGLDADIALDFHLAREENPEKFNSRFHNKGVYFQLALQKMVTKKVTAELSKHIAIAVDGLPLDLPDLEGIVILNIQSWGAGAEIWGNPSDQTLKCAEFGDGLFEVVGIGGVMHMGQMQGGLRGGTRLAQGSKCTIIIRHAVSVQVDGEPWTQRPCTITLEKCDKQAAMLQKVGKRLSTTRQMSAKNLAELQKRHTEGDLIELKSQTAQRKSRKRIESAQSDSSSSPSKLSPSPSKLSPSPPLN